MPTYIAHHDGWFFEWSTIVDAPVSEAMRRDAYESYYKERHGTAGMETLPARLERATANGTSAIDKMSAEDIVGAKIGGPT